MPPTLLGPGRQSTRIHQPVEAVACGPDTCDWFQNGSAGMNGGGEFYTHPQNARCGDLRACRPCVNGADASCGRCDPCRAGTANCPCADRLPHLAPADRPELFFVDRGMGERLTVFDEWATRTAEGVDAINFIRTRGL
jgi:hypothetical protein